MANIDGGTLNFVSTLDNDQLKLAIDETIARVQGLSDKSVAGGEAMEKAYAQAAAEIRSKMGDVVDAMEIHENAIASLENKYSELGAKAAQAFMAGRDKEGEAMQEQQRAMKGEIKVRKSLLNELRTSSDVLEDAAAKYEAQAQACQNSQSAHKSFRTELMNAKNEMKQMVAAGQQDTEAYEQIRQKVVELTQAQNAANKQTKALATPTAQYQGIISGLSGVSGALSSATGAMGLFAVENEDLQQVMTKLQSVMAVTMGLQQLEATLSKNSAFNLVTLTSLKEWWNNLLVIGTGAQTAETAAKQADAVANTSEATTTTAATAAKTANTAAKAANTAATGTNTTATAANAVAQGAQTTAAVAGTAANITLAGAFRMVGAAISSIPVFGWIAAAITALIAVITTFASKASEAKKKAEEFYNALSENAYKPIASIEQLSLQWAALGDDLQAKQQFIVDNAEKFDALGISIQGVTDAENLLNANKDAFINAQIEKAKAAIYVEQATDKIKELIKAEAELKDMPDNVMQWVQTSTMGTGYYIEVHNTAKDDAARSIEALRTEITNGFTDAANAEAAGWDMLKNAGITATGIYAEGTLGAIEQAIQQKQQALKLLTNNDDYKAAMAEIEQLQQQANAITGRTTTTTPTTPKVPKTTTPKTPKSKTSEKDAFQEKLDKMKSEYERFQKWINSGDDILMNSAKQEFAGILKQGATYIDYLKNQRDTILSIDVAGRTKEQNKQLRQLNDSIAEETRNSVLQAFNDELNDQLSNARTIIDQLNVIEERRKELTNDGTELDNAKSDALDDAQEKALEQAKSETQTLLDNYAGYVEKKRKMEQEFQDDIALMERARLLATSDEERANIDAAIANRRKQYETDSASSGDEQYDELLSKYETFQQQRERIAKEYDEKIATAQAHGNDELVTSLTAAKAKDLLGVSFDELKASPEYTEAFTDLENVSTETLRSLVARFEECKLAIGDALNPEDLAAYGEKLNSIVTELNSRDPFTALKQGYAELKQAQRELKQAEQELERVRKSGLGTTEETKAITKVNKAKDKYIKANNNVKKSQKAVRDDIKQLCSSLSELGDQIGGDAGEIISIIGDIGTFTLQAMDGVEQAAQQSSSAIKAVESASVILAVISAALQIAQKLASLFGGDDGTAAYERASEVYESYCSILDDVIEKQKELIASMSDENAKNSYEYAISLLQSEADAARELGKQYLNAGASKGFWGIGSKASNGVNQRKNISDSAWAQWIAFAREYNISIDKAEGRMTGLFDLTAEQLAKMREEAPLFYASLADETQGYLDKIIESIDSAEELRDTLNESLTGVDYDSFESDFVDMLSDMDASAADFANNFKEYMRKALINQMFKSQFKSQLEEYYKMWANAFDVDSDGGSSITEDEQAALDALQNSIITGAKSAADKINAQFDTSEADTSLSGAVAGVSEETASLVAGQMNAIRINQLEAAETMRQSLLQLNTIALNTAYCSHLAKIDRVISLLENSTDNSLRSQGIG